MNQCPNLLWESPWILSSANFFAQKDIFCMSHCPNLLWESPWILSSANFFAQKDIFFVSHCPNLLWESPWILSLANFFAQKDIFFMSQCPNLLWESPWILSSANFFAQKDIFLWVIAQISSERDPEFYPRRISLPKKTWTIKSILLFLLLSPLFLDRELYEPLIPERPKL